MPLPALPANSTPRLFVDYNDTYNDHVLIFRYEATFVPEDLDAWVSAFLGSLEPALVDGWSVTGCRFQEAGSIVSLPVTMPLTNAFVASSSQILDAKEAPRQTKFVGRGQFTGRRNSVGIFGLVYVTPATYRFTGVLPTWATAARNTLVSESNNFGLTIGGDRTDWYTYVNVNYNSYWETEARG